MTKAALLKQDQELKDYLESMGYYNIRFLEEGVICNAHFIFTDAVLIDVNRNSYSKRICYPRGSGLAEKMCLQMKEFLDKPIDGYTTLK